jgi:hypothetical protein
MVTAARSKRPQQSQAPPGALEMLQDVHRMMKDIHDRVVRIETRQARQLLAQGLDTEGKPLQSER